MVFEFIVLAAARVTQVVHCNAPVPMIRIVMKLSEWYPLGSKFRCTCWNPHLNIEPFFLVAVLTTGLPEWTPVCHRLWTGSLTQSWNTSLLGSVEMNCSCNSMEAWEGLVRNICIDFFSGFPGGHVLVLPVSPTSANDQRTDTCYKQRFPR